MKSATKTDNSKLYVKIKAQAPLSSAQQKILRKAVHDGTLKGLQHGCRVAEDVNAAISGGLTIGSEPFKPNPNSRARFGKNQKGNAYLTFGVIGPNGEKYTVTWQGAAIPMRMKVAAVAHDEGQEIPNGPPVQLPFAAATIRPAGDGSYVGERGKLKKDSRPRHDIDPEGNRHMPKKPRKPRKHQRLCSRDLLVDTAATLKG